MEFHERQDKHQALLRSRHVDGERRHLGQRDEDGRGHRPGAELRLQVGPHPNRVRRRGAWPPPWRRADRAVDSGNACPRRPPLQCPLHPAAGGWAHCHRREHPPGAGGLQEALQPRTKFPAGRRLNGQRGSERYPLKLRCVLSSKTENAVPAKRRPRCRSRQCRTRPTAATSR